MFVGEHLGIDVKGGFFNKAACFAMRDDERFDLVAQRLIPTTCFADESRTLVRVAPQSSVEYFFDLLPMFRRHSVTSCSVDGRARPWPFATLT